ncbi:hypothetical protein V6N11_052673 [Hibiscus sabdariffa]|uniref:Uncharacterized protein n=1 Tax=Hibiscus sabdariffa TaxID=183260 RepID=A0ABR2UAQ9_9ROSI
MGGGRARAEDDGGKERGGKEGFNMNTKEENLAFLLPFPFTPSKLLLFLSLSLSLLFKVSRENSLHFPQNYLLFPESFACSLNRD